MVHTLAFPRSRAWMRCVREHKHMKRGSIVQASRVLLTREAGKNAPVIRLLQERGISFYELPMIQTTEGPDKDNLTSTLGTNTFDWIVITSPEAASVFADSWRAAGRPDVQVAVVGKGTSKALSLCAPQVKTSFVPSVANAETLSAELPLPPGNGQPTVLYPASLKAKNTLQHGLATRGCKVVRLNTYNTEKVMHVSQQELKNALACDVIAIASPSALKAWVNIAGEIQAIKKVLACIGSTSGNAALALGYEPGRVLWSETPGLQGLVESIERGIATFDFNC